MSGRGDLDHYDHLILNSPKSSVAVGSVEIRALNRGKCGGREYQGGFVSTY